MLFHLLFICSNLFSHLWIKCTQSTLKCDWSLTSRPSLMVTQDSSGGQGLGSFFPREQTQKGNTLRRSSQTPQTVTYSLQWSAPSHCIYTSYQVSLLGSETSGEWKEQSKSRLKREACVRGKRWAGSKEAVTGDESSFAVMLSTKTTSFRAVANLLDIMPPSLREAILTYVVTSPLVDSAVCWSLRTTALEKETELGY